MLKNGFILPIGTTYYYSVKAENGAGQLSTATNSNGQCVVSPTDGHKVDGHVRDDKGRVVVGVTVTLLTDDGVTTVGTTVTDSNGYYVFVNVTAGTYKVKPNKPGLTFVTITITITDSDIDNQDFTGTGGTQVSINIIGEITTPKPVVKPGEGKKAQIMYKVDLPASEKQSAGDSALVQVKITIHNRRGELVKTLVDEKMAVGSYQALWDGLNYEDQVASAGVYFVKLQAGDFRDMKKIVVVK